MRHNTLLFISLQTRPKYLSFITYYEYLRFAFLCYLGDKNLFRSSSAKKISWICPPIRNQYCRYRTGRKLPLIRKSISGILGEGDVNCYLDVKESAKRATTHDCYPMMSGVRLRRKGLTSAYGRGDSATRP